MGGNGQQEFDSLASAILASHCLATCSGWLRFDFPRFSTCSNQQKKRYGCDGCADCTRCEGGKAKERIFRKLKQQLHEEGIAT